VPYGNQAQDSSWGSYNGSNTALAPVAFGGQDSQETSSWGNYNSAMQKPSSMPPTNAISHKYVSNAAESGPLSAIAHAEQMRQVDASLNAIVVTVQMTAKNVQQVVAEFMERVHKSNK